MIPSRDLSDEDVPLLGSFRIPPPSEQDWCMAPGQYDFHGTYRSPHNVAEEGLFFAPGRFQGTFLNGQDDENVYFHLVNVTYGNRLSPFHVPTEDQEHDKFDTYCTIHPEKKSACYAPKYFQKNHKRTRCAKLEFPSMTGFALCRQLAMAEFQMRGTTTMGPGIIAEEWVARLSTEDPNIPNDYDGELRLFLRNSENSNDHHLKIPLTHWLTSDDQTLEASFQVMNHKPWDPFSVPEIPPGCKHAIDLASHPHYKKTPASWTLEQNLGIGKCPFGAIHRHLMLPALRNQMS